MFSLLKTTTTNLSSRLSLAIMAMLVSFLAFFSPEVQAQDLNSVIDGLGGGGGTADGSPDNLFTAIVNIAQWGVYVLAAVSVLFLVYGGVRWGTDTGDGRGAEAGQKIVINSIVGLIIAALAIIIVQIILGGLSQLLGQVPAQAPQQTTSQTLFF